MSERTERSEGHERMQGRHRMSERTDDGEGQEQRALDGDIVAPEPESPTRSGRRTDPRRATRPHRPPNALGPFVPEGTE